MKDEKALDARMKKRGYGQQPLDEDQKRLNNEMFY